MKKIILTNIMVLSFLTSVASALDVRDMKTSDGYYKYLDEQFDESIGEKRYYTIGTKYDGFVAVSTNVYYFNSFIFVIANRTKEPLSFKKARVYQVLNDGTKNLLKKTENAPEFDYPSEGLVVNPSHFISFFYDPVSSIDDTKEFYIDLIGEPKIIFFPKKKVEKHYSRMTSLFDGYGDGAKRLDAIWVWYTQEIDLFSRVIYTVLAFIAIGWILALFDY